VQKAPGFGVPPEVPGPDLILNPIARKILLVVTLPLVEVNGVIDTVLSVMVFGDGALSCHETTAGTG